MTLYLQSLYQEALGATIDFLPEFLSGIFAFILFLLVYLISGTIFKKFMISSDEERCIAVSFVKKSFRIFVIVIGAITILGTWGINITAIVAGLGITILVIAFLLRDVLSSTLAGIMILIYKPFKINDKINVCDTEGKIIGIDMRYTTLESKGVIHLIPNSKLLSESVTILK